MNLRHHAAGGGLHLVLHLHGFDGNQGGARFDPVADGDGHLDHRSWQRRDEGPGR